MTRQFAFLAVMLWMAVHAVAPAVAQTRAAEEVVVLGAAPEDAQSVAPKVGAKPASIIETIEQEFPSAFLSDSVSNRFQQDLLFRGFAASPVLGTPQGLAIYQNGARINEPFGDTVLWDLLPSFAVERVDILAGSDPLLGRNALGGAVALKMKTGTSAPGSSVELSGGSFGNAALLAETARTWDRLSAYAGLHLLREDGWRDHSRSGVAQAYGDLSYKDDRGFWGANVTLRDDSLNENAAVPIEDDPKAAFAIPDTAKNRLLSLQIRGEHDFGEGLIWRGSASYRTTTIRTANGEASMFRPCVVDTEDLCGPDGDDLESDGRDVLASIIGDGLIRNIKTVTDGGGLSSEIEISGRLLGWTMWLAPERLTSRRTLVFVPRRNWADWPKYEVV